MLRPADAPPERDQWLASGIDAFLPCTNSVRASSIAGSRIGASYSASSRFQRALARTIESWAPAASHASKLSLFASSERQNALMKFSWVWVAPRKWLPGPTSRSADIAWPFSDRSTPASSAGSALAWSASSTNFS